MSTTTDPTATAPSATAPSATAPGATAPGTTAPSIEVPGTDRPNQPTGSPRRRRLVSVLAMATVAAAGGAVWVTTIGGGDAGPAPVEIVEDGRWGGPDVYEHSRPAPDGAAPDGQQYGSADAAERRTTD